MSIPVSPKKKNLFTQFLIYLRTICTNGLYSYPRKFCLRFRTLELVIRSYSTNHQDLARNPRDSEAFFNMKMIQIAQRPTWWVMTSKETLVSIQLIKIRLQIFLHCHQIKKKTKKIKATSRTPKGVTFTKLRAH
jgi:hypothetical protein